VIGDEPSGQVHNPYVSSQHLKNPGRREGGGCKAERGIAPERTSAVREDASPKRQRSRRPLSTDQGQVPCFTSEEIRPLADLIEEKLLGHPRLAFPHNPFRLHHGG
jgi:hypothetical protein